MNKENLEEVRPKRALVKFANSVYIAVTLDELISSEPPRDSQAEIQYTAMVIYHKKPRSTKYKNCSVRIVKSWQVGTRTGYQNVDISWDSEDVTEEKAITFVKKFASSDNIVIYNGLKLDGIAIGEVSLLLY